MTAILARDKSRYHYDARVPRARGRGRQPQEGEAIGERIKQTRDRDVTMKEEREKERVRKEAGTDATKHIHTGEEETNVMMNGEKPVARCTAPN